MLAYVLAIAVGLGSFVLYMAAFFFPEVHRKHDFIWSGVGLFYALVLWVCAGRITGGVLLGQTASVALLGWLGWQTLTLRRLVAPPLQQTPVPSSEEVQAALSDLSSPDNLAKAGGQVAGVFTQMKDWVGAVATTSRSGKTAVAKSTVAESYVPPARETFGTAGRKLAEAEAQAIEVIEEAETAVRAAVDTVAEAAVEVWESEAPATAEEVTVVEPATEAEVAEAVEELVEDAIAPETAADTPPAVEDTTATTTVPPVTAAIKAPSAPTPAASVKQRRAAGGGVGVVGAIAAIPGTIISLFQGFNKKPESKPTYVRKQFRDADEPADAAAVTVQAGSKPPYVRKQFRKADTSPAPDATTAPEAATELTNADDATTAPEAATELTNADRDIVAEASAAISDSPAAPPSPADGETGAAVEELAPEAIDADAAAESTPADRDLVDAMSDVIAEKALTPEPEHEAASEPLRSQPAPRRTNRAKIELIDVEVIEIAQEIEMVQEEIMVDGSETDRMEAPATELDGSEDGIAESPAPESPATDAHESQLTDDVSPSVDITSELPNREQDASNP